MKQYNDVAILTKHFRPYRNKYALMVRSPLYGENYWFTQNERLSDGLIRRAITERVVVGWFTTFVPNVLGVDIDDHKGQAWYGKSTPSAYLLGVYNQVLVRMGYPPTILVQSPHGLHAYWILSERLPAQLLYDKASAKLGGLPVEIKPTPTISLRIPVERRVLDPATFQYLNRDLEDIIESAIIYHPALLLDQLPDAVREDLITKRRKLRSFRANAKIEDAERSIHFYDGQSNSVFLELCNVYRCAGLTEEEAFYRFQLKLEQSPLYDGELKHNPKRLLQRIRCEYAHNQYTPRITDVTPSLFNQTISEELASLSPFAKQRTGPIRRFINRILVWCDWHDEILQDPSRTAIFDYLYPYYRKNRRAGYYPLPNSYLVKSNQRYFELMPWLEADGFLEAAPYKYSKRLNICRYYRIDRERFSEA